MGVNQAYDPTVDLSRFLDWEARNDRRFAVVLVEQVDWDGVVFRSFTYSTARCHVLGTLQTIRRAYNLNSTRITVDGTVVNQPQKG